MRMGLFGPGTRIVEPTWLTACVLVTFLIGFYILVPLDRGFPTVPLFGRPLNSAIAATLTVLLVLVVQSRGAVLSYLREPYCVLQLLYTGLLILGALRAPSLLVALHWTVLYFCTFVLNYVILRHVTRVAGTHSLSKIVVALGIVAAAVSIVQAVGGIQLPFYAEWFENSYRTPPPDYSLAASRADGTMNNPILYCFLMALVIPYALDLNNKAARAAALFTIMFAAGLSGSRTGVFVVGVFAAGAFAVFRWRAVRALPAVAVGLVLLALSLGQATTGEPESRVILLSERMGYLTDQAGVSSKSATKLDKAGGIASPEVLDRGETAEVSAAFGVSLRQAAVMEGISEMTQEWGPTTWLLGRGSLTAGAIGKRLQPWYNTVDNVFLNVLYERGLSGLAFFLGAFLTFLISTRRAAAVTVHWFAPMALAMAGLAFVWDGYSMFNILAVGSMAITMAHAEHLKGSGELGREQATS